MLRNTLFMIGLMSILSLAVLAQQGDSTFSISHGPYLQEVTSAGATVLFTSNKPSYSWVQVSDEKGNSHDYFTVVQGMKIANNTFHSIRITDLSPGKKYEYRICAKEITQFHPYSVLYGDSIHSNLFSFTTLDPTARELSFIALSDIHGNNQKLEQLLRHTDVKGAEMVIYAGDMMDYFDKENQPFNNFIDKSVELFASEKPFLMVRGNHETRGQYARDLFRYFPREDGRYYFATKQGPAFFIFLDSGEDKTDAHPVYAGLNNFDEYRNEQAEWLQKVVSSNEFKNACFRIVVSHIPPIPEGLYAEKHISQTWLPILNKANIDLMMAGHLHEYKYYPNDSEVYNFPLIIGSNDSASKIYVNDKMIKVTVMNTEGETLDTMKFKARE